MVKIDLVTRLVQVHEAQVSANARIGDLVLLRRSEPKAYREEFAYFGVLSNVPLDKKRAFTLDNLVVFYPAKYMGENPLYIIEKPNRRDAALDSEGQGAYRICRPDLMSQGWAGQKNIIAALKTLKGFEPYADYVASLKAPFLHVAQDKTA